MWSVAVSTSTISRSRARVQPWIGGLTKLYRISECVTESGRAPVESWWSNGVSSWSRASSTSPAARASALKQWSQLPHLVHPVLGHQHRLPLEESAGRDGRRPEDVGGQFDGGRLSGAPRGDRVDEAVEGLGDGGHHLVEGGAGAIGAPRGFELLDRQLPPVRTPHHDRSVARAEQLAPLDHQLAADRGHPVSTSRFVRGEDRGAVDRVAEQVGAGEGRQLLGRVGQAEFDPASAQPDRVLSVEDRLDEGFAALGPGEHRGGGAWFQFDARAPPAPGRAGARRASRSDA